jgi:hypothetical protein
MFPARINGLARLLFQSRWKSPRRGHCSVSEDVGPLQPSWMSLATQSTVYVLEILEFWAPRPRCLSDMSENEVSSSPQLGNKGDYFSDVSEILVRGIWLLWNTTLYGALQTNRCYEISCCYWLVVVAYVRWCRITNTRLRDIVEPKSLWNLGKWKSRIQKFSTFPYHV